ncbi:MAG TPA: PEGA domain-containing protein [Terriglobales bacterium]|nr:PEGA domain-containing protein [Terriglobales bacterium]
MHARRKAALAAMLLLGLASPAQQPADEARRVLEKALRFAGGKRLQEIYAVRYRSARSWRDQNGELQRFTFDTFVALPDRAQLVATGASNTAPFVLVITANEAHGISGGQTQTMPAYWLTNWQNSMRRSYFYVAKHAADPDFQVRMVGDGLVGTTPVKVIELRSGGASARWSVEPASGRLLRLEETVQDQNGTKQRASELSDLRTVDGVTWPFHAEYFEDGKHMGSDDLQGMELNPPVDPRFFYRQPLALSEVPFRPAVATAASLVRPAVVTVRSQPGGAQVYVDDIPKGTTSAAEGRLVLTDVAAGPRRLRVSAGGYREWAKAMEVESGDELEVLVTLERAGPPPLTVEDVEKMLSAGVAPKRAAMLVQERGVDFVLDDAKEGRLRAAGADVDLLLAIAKAKR